MQDNYESQIQSLLPKSQNVKTRIEEVRSIALPSVLECLQEGFASKLVPHCRPNRSVFLHLHVSFPYLRAASSYLHDAFCMGVPAHRSYRLQFLPVHPHRRRIHSVLDPDHPRSYRICLVLRSFSGPSWSISSWRYHSKCDIICLNRLDYGTSVASLRDAYGIQAHSELQNLDANSGG